MVNVTGTDQKLRHTSLVAFYFGTRAALDLTSYEAIKSVSRRAYRDLSRTLHGIGSHPNKKALLDDTHASLHPFITDLEKSPPKKSSTSFTTPGATKESSFQKASSPRSKNVRSDLRASTEVDQHDTELSRSH